MVTPVHATRTAGRLDVALRLADFLVRDVLVADVGRFLALVNLVLLPFYLYLLAAVNIGVAASSLLRECGNRDKCHCEKRR